MRKVLILVLIFVCCIVFGCKNRNPDPEKVDRVNIAFDDWVGYGLFYLAQEKGFCKEEGIDLDIIFEPLDSARRDALKQRILDFEGGSLGLLVLKAAQDIPVVMVMELDLSYGADAIVSSKEIKSIEDLLNKKIALSRDDAGEHFISYLFYKKNLPFSKLKIIPTKPGNVATDFIKGKVDACVTWEPQVSKALQRSGAHVLATTRDYPGIIIDSLNVRRDILEKRPDLVKRLMRAWFKALEYYKDNPKESNKIIAKYYGVTPADYAKQVEGVLWNNYEKQMSPSKMQEWADAFDIIGKINLANGRIGNIPRIEEHIDYKILKDLYEDSK